MFFLTSDNPRFEKPENILKDMEKGAGSFSNFEIVKDRKKAIVKAIKKIKKDFKNTDVYLAILGKGDEDYLDIKGEKKPYSDKNIIKQFFEK